MRNKFGQFGLIVVGVLIGVAISLNFSAVAQRDSGALPLPIEELRAFTEVFGRVKSDYVEPVEDKKLITEAINGMLTGLDPHSAYLDQEAFRELQVGTQGEFGGLGIEVGMEDGFVKVVSPIDDSPASRAGIKSGDLIVKLDETSVKGMTLNDAVKRMRGKPNTNITLTIVRKGEPKPVVVTLTRAIIKIQSVKSKLIEPGYAYIRVSQFQEHTGENLAKAIEALFKQNQGPMQRPRARSAQRSGRAAERRRGGFGRVPAAEFAGRLHRRAHRRLAHEAERDARALPARPVEGRLPAQAARRK